MARIVINHILNIQGPEGFTSRFEVPIGITLISRQAGVGLQLNNKFISRRHARLECIDTECHITDLGSDNGTFINGVKLEPDTPTLLNNEDLIKIGPFILSVEKAEILVEEEPQSFAEEEATPEDISVNSEEAPPPVGPPPPEEAPPPEPAPEEDLVPPGLTIYSERLLSYLPGIYHTDFMSRFLGIFEAILSPIEWTIDNFNLFLSPATCPTAFLPWLANWFEIVFDDTWSETKRRDFLREAHDIYMHRGTKKALSRTLEIYTGIAPEIDDLADDLEPHTFRVYLAMQANEVNRGNIEILINAHKPAHTAYELHFENKIPIQT
jgi:phage tail-like protein